MVHCIYSVTRLQFFPPHGAKLEGVTQFIQFKKRQADIPRKMAVPYIGRQNVPNSTCPIWVLGPKLFLDNR